MHISTKSSSARLIGLCGYATAGKDALADIMVEKLGYIKIGFADKLYELALAINPIIWKLPFPQRLSSLVKKHGWTKAKRIKQVRSYLQWLGMKCRELLGDDVWVNTVRDTVSDHLRNGTNVAITNCRFVNEADMIESLGGSMVLVERPGVGPVNGHVSDSGQVFSRAVFRVLNDKKEEDLTEWADALHAAINGVHPSPIINNLPFQAAIAKAITSGVELILNTSAPASTDAQQWRTRHKIELDPSDTEFTVLVDGEVAGVVRYQDNIVEIDAKIAR